MICPISLFTVLASLVPVRCQDSMAELLAAFSKKLAEDAVTLESSHDKNSAYDDYFDFEDDWNSHADLWINSDDYLDSDTDYVFNREIAAQAQLKSMGYQRDPRMPPQPKIALHHDAQFRVEHIVKQPPLPPGFAYSIRHCVAQSEFGPVYKIIYNKCLDHKLGVMRHAPTVATSDTRITFRKFRFLGNVQQIR